VVNCAIYMVYLNITIQTLFFLSFFSKFLNSITFQTIRLYSSVYPTGYLMSKPAGQDGVWQHLPGAGGFM
jgi:hypothetical protein